MFKKDNFSGIEMEKEIVLFYLSKMKCKMSDIPILTKVLLDLQHAHLFLSIHSHTRWGAEGILSKINL